MSSLREEFVNYLDDVFLFLDKRVDMKVCIYYFTVKGCIQKGLVIETVNSEIRVVLLVIKRINGKLKIFFVRQHNWISIRI